jgi:hypothetical protein
MSILVVDDDMLAWVYYGEPRDWLKPNIQPQDSLSSCSLAIFELKAFWW